MWSITLNMMKKSARMLIPAGIAVLIGAAFIAATFLFGNSLNASLSDQLLGSYANATHVTDLNTDDLSDEELQSVYDTTVSNFHVDAIEGINGVQGVRVDASTLLTVTKGDNNITDVAIATTKDAQLLPVQITEGAQPSADKEIALSDTAAKQLNATVGDTVTVNAYGVDDEGSATAAAIDAKVTGITADANGVYSYYGGAGVVSDDIIAAMHEVQDFNHVPTTLLYLDLSDASDATVKAVEAQLPKGYTVSTRQQAAQQAIESMSASGANIVTVFLLCFGILAMVVAAMVIANTFQVIIAQRRRTLALLRTIGADKKQLYSSVLIEAGLLGFIASALGVLFGIGLMAIAAKVGVLASINGGGKSHLIITWPAIVVPIVFGVAMTVIASISAAKQATDVTPLEALRPIELTDTSTASHNRSTLGVLCILLGLVLAGLAAVQVHGHDMDSSGFLLILLQAIFGALLVFIGVTITAVFWMPKVMEGVGNLVAKIGPSANIANANIQKNPRRIAATGTALLIGVTLVATIATGAASAKQSMGNTLSSMYSVDMVASGITESEAKDAAKVDGITDTLYAPTAAAQITLGSSTDDGDDVTRIPSVLVVGVSNLDDLKKVININLDKVTLGDGDVLVPEYETYSGEQLGFDGKTLSFAIDEGSSADSNASGKTLSLKAQQADYRQISSAYSIVAFVNASHFTNGDITATDHMLLMKTNSDESSSTLSQVYEHVQKAFSKNTNAIIAGPVAQRQSWDNTINAMMLLLVGLIAVAVIIALIGVANTLSLSVIERTRESATLRAIGMTKGQLRRSLAIEALLIAVVAGVVGIILGTLFGWLGSYMVFSLYGKVVFPFEWGVNGIMLGVAIIAALLASVLPARRAVKTAPIEALAEA